ncbi:hypothetical protein [Mycobacterium sp. E3198]|uniref:hypothetical protein n=1 Tax=Mycobacterium sp. E3198 TaxID=1834143 RepID=UPI0012EAE62B|nr:hypothetical protein [Mycobacterium sp. E3198]
MVELYQRYIARLDRDAIRDAVEHRALIASRDSVLLELHCAFDTIKALRRLGWKAPPTGILWPPVIFRGQRDEATVEVFYQATPGALSAGSQYREVQAAHEFSGIGGLIPDLIIKTNNSGEIRWLVVEVKGGYKRTVADSARAATLDLFSYRRAFGPVLDQQHKAYGLGYVWGEGLRPSLQSDVTLCTPDTLPDALSALIPR